MISYMGYKRYLGSVEYSKEDNLLHGSIAGISDSVSYHGHSLDELQVVFEEAVDDYLEMCRAEGLEPDVTCRDALYKMFADDMERLIGVAI